MPQNSDSLLLESVATHRARLRSAFLLGWLVDRRQVNDNVKRFVGSVVLAAVACVGCVGYSFVVDALARQAAERAAQSSSAPAVPTSTPRASDAPPTTGRPGSSATPTDDPTRIPTDGDAR
ncbi:hypothetical protein [Frigoribacterium sp. PvP032]|uniref:hypothetical protein n=1 Tax=Frigoribacterium sp. PvP032 TaxID=2806589 RepID=UPI001AEA00CA|nr:hypothetical protein [Frigoribacterium sp. PvP032]MBP1190190.1 hypothetical protein [Frigoribacterium sp. PvP032]